MADEITATVNLRIAKGNLDLTRNASDQYDMSGSHVSHQVQTIPTTAGGTALDISSGVATYGWAFFRNLDDTNFVTVGVVQGGTYREVAKLKAGEFALLPLATTTLYALADTASVDLEYCVTER